MSVAERGTPPFASHFDGNQVPSIMGVVGTMGTSDTAGTSQTIPFAVDPATGAAYVNILQGSINIGTIAEDITVTAGTITRVSVIGTLEAGTVTVGSISNIGQIHNAGTLAAGDNNVGNVDIVTIPQVSVGTLPTLNLTTGTITAGSLTNLAMIHAGTLTTLPQISIGTLPTLNLTTGTLTTGSISNVAMLHAGTISTLPQISIGTIPQASVGTLPILNLTTGTLTTGSLSNVAMLNAGTITTLPQVSIGTLPTLNLTTGTITTGSLSNVAMLNAGTVVQASGTITLVSTVTTLSNLTNGSVNILTGTIQNSGTTTGVGVVSALTVGTVGGKAASGAAAVDNPVLIGGTDSGGTVYVPLVTTGGLLAVNMPTGTLNSGTLVRLSNLVNGSINVLTGTVTSVTNLAGGTVQINKTPVQIGTPFVLRGTTGVAVWGTIIAASGAGTKQYISRSSIIVEAGTVDCAITYVGVGGSEGAGVIERGKFVPSAGITNNHDPIISSGTNGTIGYWMGGAGTAIFIINYWQGV